MLDEKKFLKLIQQTLFYGVLASLVLLGAGFLSDIVWNRDFYLMNTGIALLLATPVFRVVMLLCGFFKMREYNFVMASFMVLALMVVAVLI